MFKKVICFVLVLFAFIANAQEALKYLPNDNEVKGWKKDGSARQFAGEKLYEYINGAAETYHPYNFKVVVTQDYKNKDKSLVVDIYEFSDPQNCFGIYSIERDANYNFINMGVQGYIEGNALSFWKGKYYIKIVTFGKTNVKEDITAFAKIVDTKIVGTFKEPDAVNLFPKNNLIKNSIKYFAQDMMGYSFFRNGFIADYTEGKNKYQVFLFDASKSKNAKQLYTAYKSTITQSKGFEKDLTDIGTEAFVGKSVRKNVVSFYNDNIMAGVVNHPDTEKAKNILKGMNNKK
jgi:hypothetical protein